MKKLNRNLLTDFNGNSLKVLLQSIKEQFGNYCDSLLPHQKVSLALCSDLDINRSGNPHYTSRGRPTDQARNLIFGMEYIFRNYTLEMPFRSQILKSRVGLISKQSKSDGRSRDTDLRVD